MRAPLQHWLAGVFGYVPNYVTEKGAEAMLAVAAAARIPLRVGARVERHYADIVAFTSESPEQFLDVLHYAIQTGNPSVESLDRLLVYGGSAWTATNQGLQRRVGPSAQQAFDVASLPDDVASEELQHAWINAYSREPDASDAWDHAIKAVEAILIATVVPNQHDSTLGHVIGHLSSQGHLWALVLPGPDNDYSVAPLVTMLRMLWPNPDRHASPQDRRTPSLEEAQAVVHLAVTLVQWGRDGQILKK
jgi:hypothetical protein